MKSGQAKLIFGFASVGRKQSPATRFFLSAKHHPPGYSPVIEHRPPGYFHAFLSLRLILEHRSKPLYISNSI